MLAAENTRASVLLRREEYAAACECAERDRRSFSSWAGQVLVERIVAELGLVECQGRGIIERGKLKK